MPTNAASARVGNTIRYTRAELARLEGITAELRLPATLEVIDVLEMLAFETRQARAGAVLDLRRRDRRTTPKTWREVVLISGRDVTFQAVQQWADQYREAGA